MEITEKSALMCKSCDDLIARAKQIATLGRIVSVLADGDSEWLDWTGQELGDLLSELGKLIESDLTELYPPIQDAYNNYDNSFLAELNEKMELIEGGTRTLTNALDQTKDSIKKIDLFLDKDLSPILRMRGKFETIESDINQRLIDFKKGAPEKVDCQPGTPKADQ